MDIFEIIEKKAYSELSNEELSQLKEMNIDEKKYTSLKEDWNDFNQVEEEIEPNSLLKSKLDNVFFEKFPVKEKNRFGNIKWSGLIAASLALIVGLFLFFKDHSIEETHLAKNEHIEKEEMNSELHEVEENDSVNNTMLMDQVTSNPTSTQSSASAKKQSNNETKVSELANQPMRYSSPIPPEMMEIASSKEEDESVINIENRKREKLVKMSSEVSAESVIKASSSNRSDSSVDAYRKMKVEFSLETLPSKKSIRSDSVQESLKNTVSLF